MNKTEPCLTGLKHSNRYAQLNNKHDNKRKDNINRFIKQLRVCTVPVLLAVNVNLVFSSRLLSDFYLCSLQ